MMVILRQIRQAHRAQPRGRREMTRITANMTVEATKEFKQYVYQQFLTAMNDGDLQMADYYTEVLEQA
jgi:hypothetical protein